MFTRKWLLLIVILFGGLLLLNACAEDAEEPGEEAATEEPKDDEAEEEQEEESEATEETTDEDDESGGELHFAFNAQPPTLDPTGTTATATRDMIRNVFEQLVTFDSNMEVQPMLAESFEIDEENNQVIFELREGVLFHNDKEMTSEDVVASMERWAEQSAQAKSFLEGVTFEADGDYTVIANLEKIGGIDMFIFADLTQIAAIMPKEVVEETGDELLVDLVGTGPYKFVEWAQDQHILLERFDDYQGLDEPTDGLTGKKEAYVDKIYFHVVTDPSTRVAGLQSGEYQIANFLPQDSADRLNQDDNIVTKPEINSIPGFVFNKKEGIFSDQKMRQAFAAALNLEEVLHASYGSEEFYELSHELMLEGTAWYTDAGKEKYNEQDDEKAKQLMDEAGYDGEEIHILTSREYEDYYTFAVVAQEQLKEIGMNIEVDVFDWSTVLEKREEPSEYDIFISGWGIRPTPIQYPFLDSRAEWPGLTDSPEIDALIDDIQATTDEEVQKELVAELQAEVWDYLPILKPGNKIDLLGHRTSIDGLETLVGPILYNISLDE